MGEKLFRNERDQYAFACDEGGGIQERQPGQKVHLRAEEKEIMCVMCGAYADIWLDSEARWRNHPNNCMT